MSVFLPKQYQTSVTANFLPYSAWQFVHMASGTVTGVLSMSALLNAVGLGSGAVPLAGAINWILKDGLGQLGGVLYASWFGDMFDEDPKRHRFISNIALQASTLLEASAQSCRVTPRACQADVHVEPRAAASSQPAR